MFMGEKPQFCLDRVSSLFSLIKKKTNFNKHERRFCDVSMILIYCWIFYNNIIFVFIDFLFTQNMKLLLVILIIHNTYRFVGVLFCELQIFAPFCCTLWTKQNKSNRTKLLFNIIAKNEIVKVFPYQKRKKKNNKTLAPADNQLCRSHK